MIMMDCQNSQRAWRIHIHLMSRTIMRPNRILERFMKRRFHHRSMLVPHTALHLKSRAQKAGHSMMERSLVMKATMLRPLRQLPLKISQQESMNVNRRHLLHAMILEDHLWIQGEVDVMTRKSQTVSGSSIVIRRSQTAGRSRIPSDLNSETPLPKKPEISLDRLQHQRLGVVPREIVSGMYATFYLYLISQFVCTK
ncbi:hypothetical protein ANCCEY_12437 [Ancylostoma ceylanicum]|uniref:Uncharacterized protein n=1 Tax=Ancylostoma ceylanicum TaxID=53326 RepID=A0A0D6LB64_9BILA|nr:hypothetical protein ANCCEY_12437 [Ancylostoma ceylanicum]